MNQGIEGKAGRYWHLLEDGRIQCDVCPRYCRLHEGQRGLCFVRARQGDQMVLTTYGRSSGFCIDPVLIGRDWYDITAWHLSDDGCCAECGMRCHGVFEKMAGRWSRRRQPLRLCAFEPRSDGFVAPH
jgi:hypothetical protein